MARLYVCGRRAFRGGREVDGQKEGSGRGGLAGLCRRTEQEVDGRAEEDGEEDVEQHVAQQHRDVRRHHLPHHKTKVRTTRLSTAELSL